MQTGKQILGQRGHRQEVGLQWQAAAALFAITVMIEPLALAAKGCKLCCSAIPARIAACAEHTLFAKPSCIQEDVPWCSGLTAATCAALHACGAFIKRALVDRLVFSLIGCARRPPETNSRAMASPLNSRLCWTLSAGVPVHLVETEEALEVARCACRACHPVPPPQLPPASPAVSACHLPVGACHLPLCVT